MISYLVHFSVPKLTLVLAARFKKNARKTIETAFAHKGIKYTAMEEEGGGCLVWSVQPADLASMHKLLSLTVSRLGVIWR